ncbi:hypothetical protein [Ursidibacter maritimus]|uniref:hypothetical protein n=1 Tax=Ursidibacter maritimus TaxID=1331689 RepID=UPI001E3DC337|nr:hypothetical protein [Ursidibacter maritimus]
MTACSAADILGIQPNSAIFFILRYLQSDKITLTGLKIWGVKPSEYFENIMA